MVTRAGASKVSGVLLVDRPTENILTLWIPIKRYSRWFDSFTWYFIIIIVAVGCHDPPFSLRQRKFGHSLFLEKSKSDWPIFFYTSSARNGATIFQIWCEQCLRAFVNVDHKYWFFYYKYKQNEVEPRNEWWNIWVVASYWRLSPSFPRSPVQHCATILSTCVEALQEVHLLTASLIYNI